MRVYFIDFKSLEKNDSPIRNTANICFRNRSNDRFLVLLDETSALRAALVRLDNAGPRAGRKGPAEVPSLGRRHLHPLATALALVTDGAIFPVTICVASTLAHATVSWT